MSDILDQPAPAGKYMIDTYEDWAAAQGVPILSDFAVDLLHAETAPWARFDVKGALCHLKGRDDFMTIFLLDLPPGAATAPQQHIYEEVTYVLAGRGSTTVELAGGRTHSFEWGPRSIFALPMNARYRHFNGSGTEPARLASVNDLRYILNLFRNEDFVFANSGEFPEREGRTDYFNGDGEFVSVKPGRHQWETNFVPDLASFDLQPWEARGAGGKSLRFVLAESSLGVHVSELPAGTYKKAHRHGAGYCVFAVTGDGYSLLWNEGDQDFVRHHWHHGIVYAPPDNMFHQHFNLSPAPARYLAVQMGSTRYPLFRSKVFTYDKGADTGSAEGGNQIEYRDQDPRIHRLFLNELARCGNASGMGRFMDEPPESRAPL
jgi:mannose-6-phosphate isomerase-like protein (cupin superfamily)